jgi:hypothetical protein
VVAAYPRGVTAPEDPYRNRPADAPAGDPSPTWGQAGSAAAQGYGAPPPPYATSGYGPGHGGPATPQSTSSMAIVALVLAIGSFVVLPLIPAIVALVLVPRAREEIDLSGGRIGGDGMLTAAKVIAWINIGLCVAGVLLVIAAFSLFAVVGFG